MISMSLMACAGVTLDFVGAAAAAAAYVATGAAFNIFAPAFIAVIVKHLVAGFQEAIV